MTLCPRVQFFLANPVLYVHCNLYFSGSLATTLYAISFLYYLTIALIITVSCGLLGSFLTGTDVSFITCAVYFTIQTLVALDGPVYSTLAVKLWAYVTLVYFSQLALRTLVNRYIGRIKYLLKINCKYAHDFPPSVNLAYSVLRYC